jgi:uncharacterized OB-fold protein
MASELLKPALYASEGTASDSNHPAIQGGACSCGYVFFPMQTFGCERCGSTALKPRALSGRGKLIASALVHLHAGKHRTAPFTVGTIRLDDGPIVRTLLIDDDKPFHHGDAVVTTLVEVRDAEGNTKRDLRFARA